MKRWLWLLIVLTTLVVECPATWLSWGLKYGTGGQVCLTNETGTLWHGSAEVNACATAGIHWPGRVEWQIHPMGWGLQGSLHQVDGATLVDVTGQWHGMGGEWLPGQAAFPAALLEGLGAPFTTLHPEGHVVLSWGAGHWDTQGLTPWTLVVHWHGASTRLAPIAPLGNYASRVTERKGIWHMVLSTQQGPLLLQGTGESQGTHVTFVGHASAEPEARAMLAGFLSLLGKPEGDGVHLEWNR